MNEFETWASGPQFGLTAGHFVKNEAGAYLNYPTQCYFEVWQAARKRDVPRAQFLTDVITAAGMIAHGKQDKKFARRLADEASQLQLPETTYPGHGRSECVSCCCPKGDAPEPAGYTAVDMGTAAAGGYRDGKANPELQMAHVVRALEKVRGGPVLTSNQCYDLARALNGIQRDRVKP